MFKSIAELKAEGWTQETGITCNAWPSGDEIVMTDGRGNFVSHFYSVRTDDSDYPGEAQQVKWREVEVYEVTIRRVRNKNHGQ